jgi:MFS family permease
VVLFCVGPAWPVTLFGTALSGTGAAVLVLVMPGLISDHHGPHRAIAFSAINGVAGLAALAYSLVIGAFLTAHLGWRWPYLGITAVFAVMLAAVALPVEVPNGERTAAYSLQHLRSRDVLMPWLFLVNSTLVEFPLGVWAVTYLREAGHASSGLAPILATSFALAMSAGRMVLDRLVRWFGRHTVAICYALVVGGVLLLCFVPSLAVRTIALGICGLGSGPLYPLTVDRFYVRIGDRLDSATLSAYCALASGTAITVGPLALGVLADAASLRWAVLVVPALALVAITTQRRQY